MMLTPGPRLAGACAALCLLLTSAAGTASAEPVEVEAVVAPKEQMQLDFEDGSGHFVLLVRREGQAEGNGPLAGAAVAEYGLHDVVPGESGDAQGYLVFTREDDGSEAYVKWRLRAVFVPAEGGDPRLLNSGLWEVVGGTGAYEGLEGAGTLHIQFDTETDRRFVLSGDLVGAGGGG